MAKQKLTLALEPDLIAYGKTYAAERGTSLSELLETYFAQLRATPGCLMEMGLRRSCGAFAASWRRGSRKLRTKLTRRRFAWNT